MLPQETAHRPYTSLAPRDGDHPSAAPTAPLTPDAERPLIGPIGPYELLARIGRGGLGDVYRARHQTTGEVVALKLLRGGEHADASEVRTIHREIEAARRLSHPGILRILDAGIHHGAPYYTMPLVNGGSLEKRLRSGQLGLRTGIGLLVRVARAVHAAHQQKVIHRDLKPANVLLVDDETPLVADFGLARFLDQATAHTMTGQLMGSLPYMAPEQAAGRSHRATAATDVWALGVILYEMLAGKRPFRGDSHTELLYRIQHDEPPTLRHLGPGVPAELEAVCRRCLEKEPHDRYASAGRLADDLQRWLDGAAPDAALTSYGPLRALGRRLGRSMVLALMLGATVLFFGLAGLAPTNERRPPSYEERMRERLSQAKPGRPVTLLGEGVAGEPKLVFGEARARLLVRNGEWPWLHSPDRCLLQLLPPDPQRGDYRLTVELAHVDGEGVSCAGVYAGHTTHHLADGGSVHTYVQTAFNDPQFIPLKHRCGVEPTLTSGLVVLVSDRKRGVIPHHSGVGIARPLPGEQKERGVVVRTFVLEMRAGELPRVIIPGRFSDPAEHLDLAKNSARQKVKELEGHSLDTTPTGGAGITVWRGATSIRSVRYETLPPR